MKPTKFKHQNIVFGKGQKEYQQLPALKIDTPEGNVITCWKLTFWDRIRVLFLGRVWLNLMSFNNVVTPSYMSTDRKDLYSVPDDDLPIKDKVKNRFIRLKTKLKK